MPGATSLLIAVALLLLIPDGAAAPRAVAPGSVVDIKGSTPEWRNLLVEAVQVDGVTVRLGADVDIDLTNVPPISVGRGVTLTSVTSFGGAKSRNDPRKPLRQARSGNALGPRLFTRARPKGQFTVECFPGGSLNDNVRFSGFRLHGPDFGIGSGDSRLQVGILVVNCVGVEISNMDLAGWSGAAIRVVDEPRFDGAGRIERPEQVTVRGNYIHHNQHEGGNGYGVDVSLGGTALIQENVFDFNRHAIAGHGKSDGYRAERNLVLKGGGYHRLGFHTHEFDMHGSGNCGLSGLVNDSSWNCGRAGGLIAIHDNAFQYASDNAIKIRGTPQIEATILRNVFALDQLNDGTVTTGAIALTEGRKNITIGSGPNANVTGYDSFGKYGICDFDGDGKDDLFLATGATWWYSSSGEFQWTYLKQATERLDQLRLGYIDGDGRCDVLAANGAAWELSSAGFASWRSLGTFNAPLGEVVLGRFGPPGPGRTSSAFRRAPDGQWYVTSLAAPGWRPAQSSSIQLAKLRFGDFTGDGITDVLAVQGGRWSISQSATGSWQTLNAKLSQDVASLLIADVDADGRDDIVRYQKSGATSLTSSVSWGGRSDWVRLANVNAAALTGVGGAPVALRLYPFAGRFDAAPGADLLLVDVSRIGRFTNRAGTAWNSQYAY